MLVQKGALLLTAGFESLGQKCVAGPRGRSNSTEDEQTLASGWTMSHQSPLVLLQESTGFLTVNYVRLAAVAGWSVVRHEDSEQAHRK